MPLAPQKPELGSAIVNAAQLKQIAGLADLYELDVTRICDDSFEVEVTGRK